MALLQTNVTSNTVAATSLAHAWTSNTTTGSTVIIGITNDGGATNNIQSVTDSQSNTYTRVYSTIIAGVITQEVWIANNITSGTTPTVTVTMTAGAGTAILSWIAREYSGMATSALDVSNSAADGATTTTHTSPATTTTAQANEVIIGIYSDSVGSATTVTAGTGFANAIKQNSSTTLSTALEDKTVAATGTQTASMTSAPTEIAIMGVVCLKISGGVVVIPRLMMMGTGA